MDNNQQHIMSKPTIKKKLYRSPSLTEYGDVSKLTKGPSNSAADAKSGKMLSKGM